MEDMTPDAVQKLNTFGLELFCRLAHGNDEDVLICPLSIACAASILLAGTTEDSVAEKELIAWLGDQKIPFPAGSQDKEDPLRLANSAWVQCSLRNTYSAHVKKAYDADVFPVPHDAAIVNDWVSKATDQKIPQIIEAMPRDVIVLLVNAVFFKVNWTTPFDPVTAYDSPFYGPTGRHGGQVFTTVRMMKLMGCHFRYAEVPLEGLKDENIKVVELPYGKGDAIDYVATIVVPTGMMTIPDVIQILRDGKVQLWNTWMGTMSRDELAVLAMPRFKLECAVPSLVGTFRDMGIRAAFTGDVINPPLARMTDDRQAFVDDLIHKATVECNESGTVAAAASMVSVIPTGATVRPSVVLDRPFLFTIRNRVSGAIVFIGKVTCPATP